MADLSGGEQQMLAIARALVQSPKLLLIDEMSMGLAPVAVESLMPVIRQVADEHGASVIMVEQHVQLALEVADEALVLVHGNIVLSGSAEKFRADISAVEAAYMSGGAGQPRLGGLPAADRRHVEDEQVGELRLLVLRVLLAQCGLALVPEGRAGPIVGEPVQPRPHPPQL